jgi:mono/diheme cytochrome c family protein
MDKARWIRFGCYALLAFAVVGCHPDMWIQPKHKAQDASDFFEDGASSRLPVKGTVAFGDIKDNDAYYRGYVNGKLVDTLPVPLTKELLERGQERFEVFCKHCHGMLGDGQGMIAQRGFNVERTVATYHTDRLRQMPVGHFFDVITNGYGAMFPFSDRIPVEDRWAIVSYIRVLQASQNGTVNDVPADKRAELDKSIDDLIKEYKESLEPAEPKEGE